MFWLIQSNLFGEAEFDELVRIMEVGELPHQFVTVVPFSGELIPEPCIPDGYVCVLGSTSMARMGKERGWIPGSFLNDNYDAAVWMMEYGDLCANHGASICRFGDVDPWKYDDFFLRPCLDDKSFNGNVISSEKFSEWKSKIMGANGLTVSEDTMVVHGPAMNIAREWRCFMVDGKAVTSSLYRVNGRLLRSRMVDPSVIEFAEAADSRWRPSRAYALDVWMVDGRLTIGEINNINSAGWYDGDISKVIQAIDQMEF